MHETASLRWRTPRARALRVGTNERTNARMKRDARTNARTKRNAGPTLAVQGSSLIQGDRFSVHVVSLGSEA